MKEVRRPNLLEQWPGTVWLKQVGRVPDAPLPSGGMAGDGVNLESTLCERRDRVTADESGGACQQHSPLARANRHAAWKSG
jgi:hypothetical protein